jgi:hypothetical protein
VVSFSMSIDIGVILPTSTPDPARPVLGDVRESARFADVAPELAAEPRRAAEQLSAYEAAGAGRVILPPAGPDWRSGYEFAAAVRAAVPRT